MLQAIRDRATGWFAYAIVILLTIPFALWGINSYFTEGSLVDAAEVNGEPISQAELQQAFQQQRAQQQQRFGGDVDLSPFEATLREQALQGLIDDRVLSQIARAQRMRVGDRQLNEAIRNIPVFVDQDGRFDPERYQRMLAMQGYSAQQFEESYRTDLAVAQLRGGIAGSSLVTRQELEAAAALWYQRRKIDFIRLSLADAIADVELSDDEISAYYEENKERFDQPEQMRVAYLELDLDAMAASIPVGDDTVREEYERQRERFTTPAERSLSHIFFPLDDDASDATRDAARERAEALAAAIAAGEQSFADALAAVQAGDDRSGVLIDGGSLGSYIPNTLGPALDAAARALDEQGAISPVVRSADGLHILHLDRYTPEQRRPFDEVRNELRASLQRSLAEGEFYNQLDDLANLSFENRDSLQPAADALGIELRESGWFTRSGPVVEPDDEPTPAADADRSDADGSDADVAEADGAHAELTPTPDDGQTPAPTLADEEQTPAPALDDAGADSEPPALATVAAVRDAAFSEAVLDENRNSDVIEVSANRAVVLRKLEYRPAQPLPLDAVRDDVVAQLKQRRAAERLDERAQALLNELGNGAALTEVAAAADLELTELGLVERVGAPADRALLNVAFALPAPADGAPSYGDVTLANGDRAVIALSEVVAGRFDDLAEPERDALRQQIAGQRGIRQFGGYLQAQRDQADIVTYRLPTTDY